MSDTDITPAEQSRQTALDVLQPAEIQEYERHCRSGKADLSPDVNKRLYELYLNGLSIQNIMELNPGFNSGQIVKARVDGRWDERKSKYLGEILGDVPARMRQLAAESLGFMSLLLNVAHKEHGLSLRKYLQTGNPKDLGEFRITNFKQYQAVIDSVSTLLEAGKGRGPEATPLVNVNVSAGASVSVDDGEGGHKFTSDEADALREMLEKKSSGHAS